MDFISAIILGVVEGITEFLPISSTFHLIQASRMLNLLSTDFLKLFNVAIQSGAVFSIFFLFKREVWFGERLYLKMLVSSVPALVAGVFLHSMIKDVFFESPTAITLVFIAVGVIFLIVEWVVSTHRWRIDKGLLNITFWDAILIGLAQVFALVPGVSRSGSVIVAMLLMNYRREDAATYSLALSIPIIFAASGYDIYKSREMLLANANEYFLLLLVGFTVSFVVGYFAAKWLVRFLQNHTLRIFGIYRIIAGILLLLFVTS